MVQLRLLQLAIVASLKESLAFVNEVAHGVPTSGASFLSDRSSRVQKSRHAFAQARILDIDTIDNSTESSLVKPQGGEEAADAVQRLVVMSSGTYISIGVIVLAAIFFCCYHFACAPNEADAGVFSNVTPLREVAATTGQRSLQLDNAKFVANFLVIFGHILFGNLTQDWYWWGTKDVDSWLLGGQKLCLYVMSLICVAKMPMICFISGILSKGMANERRMRRFISGLLVPMCLVICVLDPLFLWPLTSIFAHDFQVDRIQTPLLGTAPYGIANNWYLHSLVIWRGSSLLVWNHLKPSVAFVCMLVISCVGGYYEFGGFSYGLVPPHTFGYLPFFAAGLVIPWQDVSRAAESFGHAQAMRVLALVCSIIYGSSKFYAEYELGACILDFHYSYPWGTYNQGDHFGPCQMVWASASGADYALFWTRRLALFLVELSVAISFLLFVVPRGKTPFTWIGSHTLYPYVFHMTFDCARNGLVQMGNRGFQLGMLNVMLRLPVLTSTWAHVVVLLLQVPYVLLVMMICSSSYFRMLFGWVLEPTWFNHFLKPTSGAAVARKEVENPSC